MTDAPKTERGPLMPVPARLQTRRPLVMRVAVVAIAMVALAPVSLAFGASDPDEVVLLDEGKALLRQGKDAEALIVFERAYAIGHSPRALFHVVLAECALSRWLAADEHLRTVNAAKDDPWIAEHRDNVRSTAELIQKRVGDLEVTSNVAGASVNVDGRDRGVLPLAESLRLVAGSATLIVSAPGHVSVTRPITIVAGQRHREVVELVKTPDLRPSSAGPGLGTDGTGAGTSPIVSSTPDVSNPEAAAKSRRNLWMGIGIGAGVAVVAAVALGLVFGIPNNAPDVPGAISTQPARF